MKAWPNRLAKCGFDVKSPRNGQTMIVAVRNIHKQQTRFEKVGVSFFSENLDLDNGFGMCLVEATLETLGDLGPSFLEKHVQRSSMHHGPAGISATPEGSAEIH